VLHTQVIRLGLNMYIEIWVGQGERESGRLELTKISDYMNHELRKMFLVLIVRAR
jgi:hypothetical protein